MNQECCSRSWMFALGGVLMLAGAYAGFSLLPAGCSPQSTANSGGAYGAKSNNGSKQVAPKKSPAKVEIGEGDNTPDENPQPKKRDLKFRDRHANAGSKEAVPVPAESTRQLHEPIVAMSDAHAKTCLVKVGDAFPELKLAELGGSEEELSQLRGKKLTVVVFWNSKKVYAAEQFARLKQEVDEAYSKFGVKVVAINVGDSPEAVKKLAQEHEVEFACLLDPTGEAYKQVATKMLPRTYLLDAEGKILWFDIEYSQGMRYELNNAVFYFLKKNDT